VHSDPDAGAAFVAEADGAVRLPGATPADTYLRADLIVGAALRAGADAVHPGYGFLSENAAFARAVADAGLTWVGPDADSIDAMGSKVGAKALMAAAGVPVLDDLGIDSATADDLPLLVKASAGGGGRGMRILRDLAALAAEIEAASSEAASAFGDGTVFVEPYVEHGRHVEVQVLGAVDGVFVLGERDCSVQRRHQKVIEEAPAPELSDATRAALHDAARSAATAIDYRGAGTVEFLYDAERDRFFFLEMNTRLQVEHPVTEAVFGVDLVALQIAVAEGRPIAELLPDPLVPRGHAVEVRLYAEDPADGYLPQSGQVSRFELADAATAFTNPPMPGIRMDSGVGTGDTIGTDYDAMIAKLIAWAPTRHDALRRLAAATERAEIHGLRTNRDLLVTLLRHPFVTEARMDTTWLDGVGPELAASDIDAALTGLSAFAAAVALAELRRTSAPVQQRIPSGFRNVFAEPLVSCFTDASGEMVEVHWRGGRDITWVGHDDVTVSSVELPDGLSADAPVDVTLDVDGVVQTLRVFVDPPPAPQAPVLLCRTGRNLPVLHNRTAGGNATGVRVDVESSRGHVALRRVPRFSDPDTRLAEGSLLAPMPGRITAVLVTPGDEVTEGQALVVMEAMKMQHTIAAPCSGTVGELAAEVGDQVDAGAVLAVVRPEPGPAHDTADSTTEEP